MPLHIESGIAGYKYYYGSEDKLADSMRVRTRTRTHAQVPHVQAYYYEGVYIHVACTRVGV